MNETFTTVVTVSAGEMLAALKLAFPTNVRIQAMPVGAVTIDTYGSNGIQIKWTRGA